MTVFCQLSDRMIEILSKVMVWEGSVAVYKECRSQQ